jgi:hypothetical protein
MGYERFHACHSSYPGPDRRSFPGGNMTTRLSIVRALLPNKDLADWHLDLAFLMYLWELGEDTVLETGFYEPFKSESPFDKTAPS